MIYYQLKIAFSGVFGYLQKLPNLLMYVEAS
jgi:hypothetical protein